MTMDATIFVLAAVGIKALWLTYLWLASAIICSFVSRRKGYGEKAGLGSGLLLSAIGIIVWLVIPSKADSDWKRFGPFGRNAGHEGRPADTGGSEDPGTFRGSSTGAR
jgi:hypothetical protein